MPASSSFRRRSRSGSPRPRRSASTMRCSTSPSRRTGPIASACAASPATLPRPASASSRRAPIKPVKGGFDNPIPIKLEFAKDTASACPVFAGRLVRGVKNGPSPDWLQRRLRAIGLRPINALVDITNYISYDRARPLHVYDADKLTGAIRARLGKTGEKFAALDGKTYTVDETMCVIADEARVLGLGGVIGGEETGCTEATTNVFIESAYFDPKRTARTGRATEHPVRRTLPLRARRRSGIRAAGLGACHADGVRPVRREPEHGHGRWQDAEAEAAVQVRHDADRPLKRNGAAPSRHPPQICGARRQARGQGQCAEGRAAVMASGYHRRRRSRGRGGTAHRRRSRAVDAARTHLRGRGARC